MTNLSPAAQAILDTANNVRVDVDWWPEGLSEIVAAALRAAADQVVPEPSILVPGGRTYEEAWTATVQDAIRRQFLAIAEELEGSTHDDLN